MKSGVRSCPPQWGSGAAYRYWQRHYHNTIISSKMQSNLRENEGRIPSGEPLSQLALTAPLLGESLGEPHRSPKWGPRRNPTKWVRWGKEEMRSDRAFRLSAETRDTKPSTTREVGRPKPTRRGSPTAPSIFHRSKAPQEDFLRCCCAPPPGRGRHEAAGNQWKRTLSRS